MSEREIFLAAREHADQGARAAYLAEACGSDAGLRGRIERLLGADGAPDSILDVPAVALPDAILPAVPTANQDEPDTISDRQCDAEFLPFLAPPGRPDSLGRIGHYEVLEVLGKGGFGIVFRASDKVLERVVAVKVLSPLLAVTSPPCRRFLREAQSAAAVRHENVVRVYAVEEQPLPYLVMEFIPGETLQQRLDRLGPLEVPEVLRIGRQIAEGLAAAHATGLIHRDVKPANVLIERGPHEHVKLTDFGLARAADDASLTQSGVVAGTPMYMSPEQARGEHLDPRSDLFSLGSVLYVMATGRLPFRAANTLAVLKRVAEDTPRSIPDVSPEVPPWLCELIAKLHAKDPNERFQSAQEVADLLGRCQAEGPPAKSALMARVDSLPSSQSEANPGAGRPGGWARWHGGLYGWIAVAIVLLLFTGLGLTETTGVTELRGTVVRLFTPEGTLVVASDDPDVSINLEGEAVIITGAGVKELRVKPGNYWVEARKDGKLLKQELVTVTRAGKRVVQISRESLPVPKGDYALDFDGATSYVDIPSLSRDADDPLTIEAFVTVGGTQGAVLVRLEGLFPCQMYGWPGKQPAQWVPNGADHRGVKMNAANTPALTPGRRAHVAIQLDDRSVQLFIEGRRVNSIARSRAPGAGKMRGAVLGAQWGGRITSLFSGMIDEVRISKTIRYRTNFTPVKRFMPDKYTLALYHCDEGRGERLIDSSGNGHHGRVVGARWVKVEEHSGSRQKGTEEGKSPKKTQKEGERR
jgi:hypothetical protein